MRGFYYKKELNKFRKIPMTQLMSDVLKIPSQRIEEGIGFLCPKCKKIGIFLKYHTNKGICFKCDSNYNPIDLVMHEKELNFSDAVDFLNQHYKIEKGS